MQVTAGGLREYEKPMSWARAMVIAVGFFFVTGIFLGQLPSYVYTVSTSSTMVELEQGFLSLGLLALGFGLMSLEISLLYDPKPLLPWPLFALVGAGLAAIGGFIMVMIYLGPNAQGWPTGLPTPQQGYLIDPIWFQTNSIDLAGVGLDALLTGLGMFSLAVLNPWVLSGRALGPTRDLLVRFLLGLAVVFVALYLSIATFVPQAFAPQVTTKNATGGVTTSLGTPYPYGNVLLFLAVIAALFALEVWLLPIMVANRQQFMPAVYFHGVINLIGQVAVPLLLAWAATYPLLWAVHQVDSGQFWVQCSQKTKIPASCSFTQFTGYIIVAIVFQALFVMLILGLYFWSTRRNTVVLGGTFAITWLALAFVVIHTAFSPQLPLQVPTTLLIATAIVVLAYIFTWATQNEFAPTRAEPLGCTGQWLVLGTLMLVFLFGFALFSVPQIFELESGLALFWQPGPGGLHDAYWGILLMGGLALLQFALLIRRDRPMSDLRKFALWSLLLSVALMIIASIQGFKNDVVGALLSGGTDAFLNAIEGSHVVYFFGLLFALAGVGATLLGALRAGSARWMLIVGVSVLVGAAFSVVIYSLSYPPASINLPDLTTFGMIAGLLGAFAYTAIGPDTLAEAEPLPAPAEPLVAAPR